MRENNQSSGEGWQSSGRGRARERICDRGRGRECCRGRGSGCCGSGFCGRRGREEERML